MLSIPTELLPEILRHLDFRACLTQSAMVSRQFWDAAPAAVRTISIQPEYPQQLQQLAEWLSRHGRKLSHLEILWSDDWGYASILDFPMSRMAVLETLHLRQLQLVPTGEPSSMAAGSPLSASSKLTRLVLDYCDISSDVGGFAGLAVCSNLRHLQIEGHDGFIFDTSLGNALQQLAQLTNLHVSAKCVQPNALAHLTALSQLQDLTLHETTLFPADDWQAASLPTLPIGLTSLNGKGAVFSTTETCAAVRQLSQLRSLEVYAVDGFDFSVATGMTELTCLQFEPRDFYPLTSVLPVLRHLSCLQVLKIVIIDWDSDSENPTPDQCAALTASTNLQILSVTGVPLPAGAGRHMFHHWNNTCFPFLRVLDMGINSEQDPVATSMPSWPLDQPDDLRRLVSCCPALEVLDLEGAVADDVDMSPLLQLHHLTDLGVGCGGTNDEVLRGVLVMMTGLRKLDIIGCDAVTDSGVCCLTKLTGLQLTYVRHCPEMSWDLLHGEEIEEEEHDDVEEYGIFLDYEEIGKVAQRLQAICQRSKICLRIMLEERTRELQNMEAQLSAARC